MATNHFDELKFKLNFLYDTLKSLNPVIKALVDVLNNSNLAELIERNETLKEQLNSSYSENKELQVKIVDLGRRNAELNKQLDNLKKDVNEIDIDKEKEIK